MDAEMERVFVAVKLEPRVTASIATLFDSPGAPRHGVKWITLNNMHITLRFIGNVDADQKQRIAESLRRIRMDPFTIRVAKVGTFPKRSPLRIIYVGIDQGDLAVRMLHRKVEESLVGVTPPPDKSDFVTHITIARLGKISTSEVMPWLEAQRDYYCPEEMRVSGFQLMRSRMLPTGVEYDVLEDISLTAT